MLDGCCRNSWNADPAARSHFGLKFARDSIEAGIDWGHVLNLEDLP